MIVDGKETPSKKSYITEELTDYALDFISKERDNPFCLYLSHKAVHHQFLPPKDIAGRYRSKKLELPKESDSWISWNVDHLYAGLIGPLERTYRNYMETLYATDLEIGRVFQRLEDLGIADNTIIVYWGDNGYFFGEHRLMDKRFPYEEAMRVPCIIKDPRNRHTAGQTAEQMVLNIDLAPTILEMAGLTIPNHIQGKSMMPYLRDTNQFGRDAWLYEYFAEFPYRVSGLEAIRTKRYKYIEFQGRRGRELYDLKTDRLEQTNIIDSDRGRELLPMLQAKLSELRTEISP